MRRAHTGMAVLTVAACGMAGLPGAEPTIGPPTPNQCAVDVVNGRSVSLGVTLYTRGVHDLGTLAPSATRRHAEECTARSWTVRGVPRSEAPTDPEAPGSVGRSGIPEVPPVVSRTVDVRPGVVVTVVL